MELTNLQVNVILKVLDGVLGPGSAWNEGPFLEQLREVAERLRKDALVSWTADQYPLEIGNWVSACCERSLQVLQTQAEVNQVQAWIEAGQSFQVFWTRPSGIGWFENSRSDEELENQED